MVLLGGVPATVKVGKRRDMKPPLSDWALAVHVEA